MERVAWRVDQGGHTVPVDKIRSRYERSLKLASEAARIADRAYFIDNSRSTETFSDIISPLPIFRMVNGLIAKKYLNEKNFPCWTRKIYDALR